ncbi:MAG: dTDP-4-dehydrorhamnose reductase [bacterium]
MKKILIIGAKGMLGQQLIEVFGEDKNYQVIGWGKEEIDITNFDQIREKISAERPDIIINCAAYNNVDGCEENEELANLINGYAVGCLAKISQEIGTLLIHYSSGYVFDGSKEGYIEDDKPQPISKYALSKYLGEKELTRENKKFYLIRTNLLFGPGALTPGAKKSFVDLILDLAEVRDSFKFVTDEISNPTYVVDLAEVTKKLIEEKYPFGIYHLVNDGQASWYDWAKEIFRLEKIEKKIIPIKAEEYPRPAKRPKNSVLLNTKFPKLRSWQEALASYLQKR